MNTRKWTALVLAFAAAGGAGAQNSLTIEQSVERALSQNLSLAAERLKVAQDQLERDLALNRFIPSLTVGATLSRMNVETTASGLVPFNGSIPGFVNGPVTASGSTVYDGVLSFSQTVDPWNLSLSLQAQLPINFALFRGITQTQIDYENARISEDLVKARLERDVRKAFLQLLALQESITLTERQLESARRRWEQTQAQFRSGLVPELSVLQAQVAFENRKPALEEQRLAYRSALMAFQNLLGLEIGGDLSLEGQISEPPAAALPEVSSLLTRFLDRRLDLVQLSGQVRSLENVSALQHDALWPTLILLFNMDPAMNAPFESKSWEADEPFKQRGGMLGFSLSWKLDSLLPGSTSWVEREATRSSLEQVRLAREQARRGAEMEVRMLAARLQKSLQSLESSRLNVQLAQRAFQQAEASYRAGGQSLLEVQDAELQARGAELQLLNEKLTYHSTLLDLGFALNTRPEDWAQRTSE